MQIAIDELNITDNRIVFQLRVPKSLKKYFLKDRCYVQYNTNLELGNIDRSILSIPMVAMLAPISWAVGADIRVGELDETYFKSLTKIKEIYRSFYSHFSFSGDIMADKLVTNHTSGDRTGMLFSGGVDSMASYLRHRNEKPDLISIWGLRDTPHFENEYWERIWADINSHANQEGLRAFQLRTDMLTNLNHELLSKVFKRGWFGEVSHGLWVLGLCAPITVNRGIGKVIIASSYTADHKVELGFYPPVDNNVSWADVHVFHDGFELSRQQKIRFLCREENINYLSRLRCCWDSAWKTNCGNCEKCFRTMAGLLAEGVDPNKCNFEVDAEKLLYIRDCFCKGRFTLKEGQKYMWRDIQVHIPERVDTDIHGSKEFLTWLRKYDLSRHRINRLNRLIWVMRQMYSNKRMKAPYFTRKIRCYYYIALTRLKLA